MISDRSKVPGNGNSSFSVESVFERCAMEGVSVGKTCLCPKLTFVCLEDSERLVLEDAGDTDTKEPCSHPRSWIFFSC